MVLVRILTIIQNGIKTYAGTLDAGLERGDITTSRHKGTSIITSITLDGLGAGKFTRGRPMRSWPEHEIARRSGFQATRPPPTNRCRLSFILWICAAGGNCF